MADDAKGPFFVVQLKADEPYIDEIKASPSMLPSDRAAMTPAEFKQEATGDTSCGTPLTREELMLLPNGAELLEEFMAGDTSRSDRHFVEITRSLED